ncbi:MAG: class II aldolase/adducin family protein [Deltaproteobacteria bacterium]|nr:class II aldolase/adducin family protein [Deltaproteobacteria bacterium]
MQSELQLRQQLAAFSHRVWERGWVANHDGNLSLRLPRERLLCTPTGVSKGGLSAEAMLVVDASGKVLSGKGRPFSELGLHLAYYHGRPDVQAVLHAHPPTATGFGVAGVGLDRPFLPEAVVSLGPEVPTVPLTAPGSEAAQVLSGYVTEYDALLLAGNGALCCGVDLEQAYLRMELVEHLAKVALVAHQLGGIQALPAQLLEPLLAARTRAGLGPAARAAGSSTAAQTADPAALKRRVDDEIRRVLK